MFLILVSAIPELIINQGRSQPRASRRSTSQKFTQMSKCHPRSCLLVFQNYDLVYWYDPICTQKWRESDLLAPNTQAGIRCVHISERFRRSPRNCYPKSSFCELLKPDLMFENSQKIGILILDFHTISGGGLQSLFIGCSELLLNPIEIPICAEIMWNYSLKSQILLNPHFCCWKHVKVPSCNLR